MLPSLSWCGGEAFALNPGGKGAPVAFPGLWGSKPPNRGWGVVVGVGAPSLLMGKQASATEESGIA